MPTPEGLALLLGYDWPGNVRELRNVLERMVLRRSDVVTPDDLPRELRLGPAAPQPASGDGPIEETRAALTRRLMGRMLVRGESFWEVVYAPFLAHDLTRQQLRDVIQAGLDQCQGRYNVAHRAVQHAEARLPPLPRRAQEVRLSGGGAGGTGA